MPFVLDDKLREECGVFGVFARGQDVARMAYFGLFALQHRGQESAGIAVTSGEKIMLTKGLGLVSEVFDDTSIASLAATNPHIAVGHVRYATAGARDAVNSQPLYAGEGDVTAQGVKLALAHNGNLLSLEPLRTRLSASGATFTTTSDSEVLLKLLLPIVAGLNPENLAEALSQVRGAYSLILCTTQMLIGVRDPQGFRPLCLGRIDGGYLLASESAAIEALGGELVRDILPGEAVVIDDAGVRSIQYAEPNPSSCVFEYIYFARNDSTIDALNVYSARVALGRLLAEEQPATADLVISVPDSGTPAALGFAEAAGIPFGEGLVKNRYVGRTFIQPGQALRELKVRLKFSPNTSLVRGKRVVIVDDSIVRGTTMRMLVRTLRQAGASEVHVRISCPPYVGPCYFGIDTPSQSELVASRFDVATICSMIEADSLGYLSLEGMLAVLSGGPRQFCQGCFTGVYPVEVPAKEHEPQPRLEEDYTDVRG